MKKMIVTKRKIINISALKTCNNVIVFVFFFQTIQTFPFLALNFIADFHFPLPGNSGAELASGFAIVVIQYQYTA